MPCNQAHLSVLLGDLVGGGLELDGGLDTLEFGLSYSLLEVWRGARWLSRLRLRFWITICERDAPCSGYSVLGLLLPAHRPGERGGRRPFLPRYLPTSIFLDGKEQGHQAVAVVLSGLTGRAASLQPRRRHFPFNSTRSTLHPGASVTTCSCSMKSLPAPNE